MSQCALQPVEDFFGLHITITSDSLLAGLADHLNGNRNATAHDQYDEQNDNQHDGKKYPYH
jgi:hypothetical protein